MNRIAGRMRDRCWGPAEDEIWAAAGKRRCVAARGQARSHGRQARSVVGGHVKRRTKLVDGGLEVGLLFKFWQAHMANYWRDYKISLAICFSNLPNHKIWQVSFGKLLEMLLQNCYEQAY